MILVVSKPDPARKIVRPAMAFHLDLPVPKQVDRQPVRPLGQVAVDARRHPRNRVVAERPFIRTDQRIPSQFAAGEFLCVAVVHHPRHAIRMRVRQLRIELHRLAGEKDVAESRLFEGHRVSQETPAG